MKTLVRSVGRTDIGGEPLPAVFKAFESNKIIFRRAEVSMMAGTPGVGKSTLALALALKMKVPTLYISADTNAHTMAMRLASMISGKNQTDVEYLLQNDLGWTKATLAKGNHIVWSFESSPSLVDIDEEVQAFEELWGCPPVEGKPCQPRSALQGKVAQLPALICTLGVVGTAMAVAPVKNRYGRADANANLNAWLAFNPEYMYIEDIPENA